MPHMDGWFGGMWWMWIGGLLFWGSLLAFGVWAVLRFTRRDASHDARRILEERFARGEIDTEEFQRRLQVLAGGGSTAPRSRPTDARETERVRQ